MSNRNEGESPSHRKSEVSWAMVIIPGLVGPKPRANAVGDGHLVDIPEPPKTVCTARCRRAKAEGGSLTQVRGYSELTSGGSKGMTGSGSSSVLWNARPSS